jgi:hypothetical protein
MPSRFAALKEKSGAGEPISRVSVRLRMLHSTLSEVEIRNNNGWGTGDGSGDPARLFEVHRTWFVPVRYNFASPLGDAGENVSR